MAGSEADEVADMKQARWQVETDSGQLTIISWRLTSDSVTGDERQPWAQAWAWAWAWAYEWLRALSVTTRRGARFAGSQSMRELA